MTVSKINPQMSRNKALIIIAIIAVILLCAVLIPDNGGAIKSISCVEVDPNTGDETTYTFTGDKDGNIYMDNNCRLEIDGRDKLIRYDTVWSPEEEDYVEVYVETYEVVDGAVVIDGTDYDVECNKFYTTFWALVPPIVAITLALITKEVYSSLFVGILMGGILWAKFNFENTIVHVVNDGFVASIADSWDAGILLFLVVLGIIGVLVLKSGGTKAYGEWALKHIKSRKMAQLATFFLGILIFVDDYFNCLTVGSIMRPLTDKFNISRAKLAYLIDSTAAPVCIIAPVSSWAAAVTSSMGSSVMGHNTMEVFIECIPYNFYAIFTIVMIITICLLDFDFGPMKKHETNAIENGDLFSTEDRPYENVIEEKINENGHILDLILPIFVFLIPSCILCLIYTGGFFSGASFVDSFADADAATGLAMGSMIGLLITIVYLVLRKASTFNDLMDSLPKGFRNMVPAILILIFAWTLTSITKELGSSAFVTSVLADAGNLKNFLPAIFMVVACFIAFSTGTSWGTMGIMLPIVATFTDDYNLLLIGISACMAGAVFGDHCSPISDTTIMSSAGAQCSHIVHVSTQAPYALTVAGVSFVFYIFAGLIPGAAWIFTIIGAAAMVGVLFLLKTILNKEPAAEAAA